MTRIIDEQLSALLDGELPVEQEAMLLHRLERESGSRDKLARYGLIGELVRDASPQFTAAQVSALSISARVAAAIDVQTQTTQNRPAVPSSPLSSIGLGWVGAGIAASIALVVMFNLAGIGSASRLPEVRQAGLTAHDLSAANSSRLTRYLVSHAQFSNSASRQLVDSHLAMAVVSPAAWTGHE